MWYFTWILGVSFACAFAVLNAMWLEMRSPEWAASPSDGQVAEDAA